MGSSTRFKETDKSTFLIAILDGWKKDVFESLLAEGKLPGFSHIISDGMKLDNIISNLPSVSIASHLSIVSGCFIDQHGIPGHRWLDQKQKRIHNYFSLRAPRLISEDINSDITTVFDHTTTTQSMSIQGIVNHRASKKVFSPTMSGKRLLQKTADIMCANRFDTIVTWLPKVDSLAHKYGPESTQVRREMVDTDKGINYLIEMMQRNGKYDSMKLLLIPDHGQRAVMGSIKLDCLFSQIGLKAVVNPKKYYEHQQLVFTSGDSFAQVYLTENYISCREDIALRLCAFQQIELICWLDEAEQWHIVSGQGHSVAKWENPTQNLMRYELKRGRDPLQILKTSQYQVLNLATPMVDGVYPDFLHQLTRSYVPMRSGDMLLFSSKKFHFGLAPRIGFRLGFHRGSHGGPFPDEMIVSGIIKGFKISNKPIRMADVLKNLLKNKE